MRLKKKIKKNGITSFLSPPLAVFFLAPFVVFSSPPILSPLQFFSPRQPFFVQFFVHKVMLSRVQWYAHDVKSHPPTVHIPHDSLEKKFII